MLDQFAVVLTADPTVVDLIVRPQIRGLLSISFRVLFQMRQRICFESIYCEVRGNRAVGKRSRRAACQR